MLSIVLLMSAASLVAGKIIDDGAIHLDHPHKVDVECGGTVPLSWTYDKPDDWQAGDKVVITVSREREGISNVLVGDIKVVDASVMSTNVEVPKPLPETWTDKEFKNDGSGVNAIFHVYKQGDEGKKSECGLFCGDPYVTIKCCPDGYLKCACLGGAGGACLNTAEHECNSEGKCAKKAGTPPGPPPPPAPTGADGQPCNAQAPLCNAESLACQQVNGKPECAPAPPQSQCQQAPGSNGCPCVNAGCSTGLTCSNNVCGSSSCTVGTANCACATNAQGQTGCVVQGLVCTGGKCVAGGAQPPPPPPPPPPASGGLGQPCSNGLCNSADLQCVNGACNPCTAGARDCRCKADNTCEARLQCKTNVCKPCDAGSEGCVCATNAEGMKGCLTPELKCTEGGTCEAGSASSLAVSAVAVVLALAAL